jgi:hypothetical protein
MCKPICTPLTWEGKHILSTLMGVKPVLISTEMKEIDIDNWNSTLIVW